MHRHLIALEEDTEARDEVLVPLIPERDEEDTLAPTPPSKKRGPSKHAEEPPAKKAPRRTCE